MLLDRIDIDNHGPLNQVELGPFAAHLNLICSPEGSGKTAIARFIRDSLVDREYPIGMLSSSSGRIVWADEHGKSTVAASKMARAVDAERSLTNRAAMSLHTTVSCDILGSRT